MASPAAGQYAGSAACSGCHPAQYKSQSQSIHAGALKPAPSGIKAGWAFGSGAQAITYVSQVDADTYVEHGRSWYAAIKGEDLTPGHKNGKGVPYRTFDPASRILRCFQCHSTGKLSLGENESIKPSEPGVRCESCHGPGANHIARKGDRLEIFNPNRLTAEGINDFCGACHRMPPAAGEDTDWTNAWNTRHQPLYLSQSECFRQSRGRLSCFTCHDPHGAAKPVDAACAACHATPKHRAVVTGKSCAGCHMPKARPHPHLAFANHWIGVYAPANALMPVRSRTRR